jgi:peptide/nickel transport system permease protein
MIRFVVRRAFGILAILVCIVFLTQLGMGMVSNSRAARPDYDLVENSLRAWQDTRAFFLGHTPIPRSELVWHSYVNSMGLLLVAIAVAAVVGLWAGGAAALTKKKVLVLPLLALTIVGISTPSFFTALLLQVGELRYLKTFGHRLVSMAGYGWDFQHMLMPVLVLAALPLAYLTRASFLGLSRVMEEEYIRTAYSKGLTRRQTVSSHALRNIAVPVLTALGVSIRFSLSTLPVVEFFFAWPGMGRMLLEAIDSRQTVIVVVLAAALGLTFLAINLVLDVVFRMVDPRTREG